MYRILATFGFVACLSTLPATLQAEELKVLLEGQGTGTVSSLPAGIDCGNSCDFTFGNETVTLSATPASTETVFDGWEGAGFSCPGTGDCSLDLSTAKAVRARFVPATPIPTLLACGLDALPPDNCSPENIEAFLDLNPSIDTVAEFLAALPPSYKENWLLMARSESLQTGTAKYPRILLPSPDARFTFSIGLVEHDSFPGSHPDVIEYMQFDETEGRENFRFHEIVLRDIDDMHVVDGVPTFPARDREPNAVIADDPKCTRCHSTKDVPNTSDAYGTAPKSATRGESRAKNKPNWDAYDSWGGLLPYNRDRIYQGSVAEAAFRQLFNLWNWRGSEDDDRVRRVLEQLKLQPENLAASSNHQITRNPDATDNANHIRFGFDEVGAPDAPSAGLPPNTTNYRFNNVTSTDTATTVNQEARYVTLRHTRGPGSSEPPTNEDLNAPGTDEGRAVEFFDRLGGLDDDMNMRRIADELIDHRFATSDIPIDVRPIALAIIRGYIRIDTAANSITPDVGTDLAFFDARHGLNVAGFNGINDLLADTLAREQELPRRKADIQKYSIDRSWVDGSDTDAIEDPDPYLATGDVGQEDSLGLIQTYSPGFPAGLDSRRQEIFRRKVDLGGRDSTLIGGVAVDREDYPDPTNFDEDVKRMNAEYVTLFRYFLEPLGVSVDKWSMNKRGRSRAYNFADVFREYVETIDSKLSTSLVNRPPLGFETFSASRENVLTAVANTLAPDRLPDVDDTTANVPTYTDIQRIFNKSCIECHGGLNYPPYVNHDTYLNLAEREEPTAEPLLDPRWNRLHEAHKQAADLTSPFVDVDGDGDFDDDNDGVMDDGGGFLYRKVARLTNEDCPHMGAGVTRGLMPCGGPRLSQADIQTLTRWIGGGSPRTAGDPHIRTIDGVNYDFQAAGEFVLLTGPGLEVQARHVAIEGTSPFGPNAHTGLKSCVSVNGAVAMRVGNQRVTYQPDLSGTPNSQGLDLRVDGELLGISTKGIPLSGGGRIVPTQAEHGIQVETPGGARVIVTPRWWESQQLWFMTIDLVNVRGTRGLAGNIAPGNWLPALQDGSLLGEKPKLLADRYEQLYNVFGDSWRVSDSTSLFEYAPGVSTASFTDAFWPNGESPSQCLLQSRPADAPPPIEIVPLAAEEAEQLCADVADPVQRENCIGDVTITGEAGFADSYLLPQAILDNRPPVIPVLVFPADDDVVAPGDINFVWEPSSDADGTVPDIEHCIWPVSERPDGNNCINVAAPSDSGGTSMLPGINKDDPCYKLLLILLFLIILLLVLAAVTRHRRLFGFSALILLIVFALVYKNCRNTVEYTAAENTVTGLTAGEGYYWKIVVRDDNGGRVESETYRFDISE